MKTFRRLQVKDFFQLCLWFTALLGIPDRAIGGQTPGLARVFIDCLECDADYLKQEITFVNLVRDHRLADVGVMITSLPTGSGGRAYSIEVFAESAINARRDTTVVNTGPDATESERRQMLVRAIKVSLLPYIRQSSAASHLDVTYAPPTVDASAARGSRDRWKQWVFRVSGSGSFASDENYTSRGGDGSLAASRVTDQLKVDLSGKGSFNRERFRLDDGETLTSDRHRWSLAGLTVWSLNSRYSLGITGMAGSSAFDNTRFQFRIMPAIEYDHFPYSEATRRQLILRYSVGIRGARYVDTTIYHLLEESRPVHELRAISDIRQTWGAVWSSAVWSQYLHDPTKRRLSLEAGLDWRIIAGLSLNVGLNYSFIRDQLNVPGTDLTNEERLLRLREVQSGYSASGGIGLSYTFGSVFSNVVNSRFR